MTEWIPAKFVPNDENKKMLHIDMVFSYIEDGYECFKYAIRNNIGYCMNKKLIFEWEPVPSNRSDNFMKRCRFDTLKEAQEAYEKYMKKTYA